MPKGKWSGESYEARIERLAGACPEMFEGKAGACLPDDSEDTIKHHDWPQPKPPPFPADDEDDEAPDE